MSAAGTPPRRVRRVEHRWIPVRDGRRLAARLWLPEDAEARPVPAILEYIPYRKRDFTRARDEPMHHWFAGHGYAAVRVDVRGAGDSDGVLADEYSDAELDDGLDAIAWLAAQPWCTGAVGMIGKSWGGFNALQLAARRPPALRAVVSVCASDDRWADDAHYMGGCLLNENLTWGTALLAVSALPPDPALVGESWREAWIARVDGAVLHAETWLRHQSRDAYWRRGSVCEDLSRITCPVWVVGGWADAYTNAVPRLVAGLGPPSRGLVGPWAHVYPHRGVPGPAIGFLQEALRWWDRWLRGVDTGVDAEPRYRVWMQESVRPAASPVERPGRWVAEATWPSPRIVEQQWFLNAGMLEAAPGPERRLECRTPESVGLAAGEWCRFGVDGDAPGDQRDDDARSLRFDSGPLGARLEILGAPAVTLDVDADRPSALVAVRLCEVFPDGASALVTYGVRNLTRRGDDERPEPLVPGRRYRIRVQLNDVAHAFAAGSRVRVAVSTAWWPIVWPSPEAVTLGVLAGASRLELPVRPPSPEDASLRPFPEPEAGPSPRWTALRPPRGERRVERDAGETVVTVSAEGAGFGGAGPSRLDEVDLEVEQETRRRWRIRDGDPLSARAEVQQAAALRRGTWRVRVETEASLSATRTHFELRATLDAFEAGRLVRSRRWRRRIPRDGV